MGKLLAAKYTLSCNISARPDVKKAHHDVYGKKHIVKEFDTFSDAIKHLYDIAEDVKSYVGNAVPLISNAKIERKFLGA